MKEILHFAVTKEDGVYTASCEELFIVTDGKTLDALILNIKEATALYMESENPNEIGLVKSPLISVNFEFKEFA